MTKTITIALLAAHVFNLFLYWLILVARIKLKTQKGKKYIVKYAGMFRRPATALLLIILHFASTITLLTHVIPAVDKFLIEEQQPIFGETALVSKTIVGKAEAPGIGAVPELEYHYIITSKNGNIQKDYFSSSELPLHIYWFEGEESQLHEGTTYSSSQRRADLFWSIGLFTWILVLLDNLLMGWAMIGAKIRES